MSASRERPTFSAAFEGWCPICHTVIDIGDTVTYEDSKVVHSSCIPDDDDEICGPNGCGRPASHCRCP